MMIELSQSYQPQCTLSIFLAMSRSISLRHFKIQLTLFTDLIIIDSGLVLSSYHRPTGDEATTATPNHALTN
jgi:hypothetical protein